ncbi:MAG: aminoacyl-tRNA hydrolase [Acidimicrobiia bacterium]|nr:aminoacyl-tRNA hydrolase [Acidimicrobiia bacterium]
MPKGLRVGRYTIPDSDLEERFTTSGGPGGQHANRTESAVELRYAVYDSDVFPPSIRRRIIDRLGDPVTVVASESRSQWRNRSLARQRLGEELHQAITPPTRRKPTRPTMGSKRRRLEEKKRHSEKKKLRKDPEW